MNKIKSEYNLSYLNNNLKKKYKKLINIHLDTSLKINRSKLKKIGHNSYDYMGGILISWPVLFFKCSIFVKDIEKKNTYIYVNNFYYYFSKFVFCFGFLNNLSLNNTLDNIIKLKFILNNILPIHCAAITNKKNIDLFFGLSGSGKSEMIKRENFRNKNIISDDLIFYKEDQIFSLNSYINTRRLKFINILDYFLPNFISKKRTKIKQYINSTSLKKKKINFYMLEKKNYEIKKIKESLLKEKISVLIDRSNNFLDNRVLLTYFFLNPKIYIFFKKNTKKLIFNFFKKLK